MSEVTVYWNPCTGPGLDLPGDSRLIGEFIVTDFESGGPQVTHELVVRTCSGVLTVRTEVVQGDLGTARAHSYEKFRAEHPAGT